MGVAQKKGVGGTISVYIWPVLAQGTIQIMCVCYSLIIVLWLNPLRLWGVVGIVLMNLFLWQSHFLG